MNYSKLTLQQKKGKLLLTMYLPGDKHINLIQLDEVTKKGIKFCIIDSFNLDNCGIYTDYKIATNDFYKKVAIYNLPFQIQFLNYPTIKGF